MSTKFLARQVTKCAFVAIRKSTSFRSYSKQIEQETRLVSFGEASPQSMKRLLESAGANFPSPHCTTSNFSAALDICGCEGLCLAGHVDRLRVVAWNRHENVPNRLGRGFEFVKQELRQHQRQFAADEAVFQLLP